MHRLIAVILMLIIPLQFAWSAALGVHGHAEHESQTTLGMHTHAHDHDHCHEGGAHGNHDELPSGTTNPAHGEDGHHVSHFHPVFTSLPADTEISLGMTSRSGPIRHSPVAFVSRTPPPLDRPPLALA